MENRGGSKEKGDRRYGEQGMEGLHNEGGLIRMMNIRVSSSSNTPEAAPSLIKYGGSHYLLVRRRQSPDVNPCRRPARNSGRRFRELEGKMMRGDAHALAEIEAMRVVAMGA